MLQVSLTVATLLGGASALWFLWEKFQNRSARPPAISSIQGGSTTGAEAVLSGQPEADAAENWGGVASTTIFGWRMAEAFPGARGWVHLTGEEAVDRLAVLLREPLIREIRGSVRTPIWWFRAGQTSAIESFARLGATECLIDCLELGVVRIVAWRASDERQEFLYVETFGLEPTGLYPPQEPSDLIPMVEEYAIFGEHLLTRAEFDDGYTSIDGQPTKVVDADFRRRYLEPFNFLIAAQGSPINSLEFDRSSDSLLAGLLDGQDHLEALRELAGTMKQREPWGEPL